MRLAIVTLGIGQKGRELVAVSGPLWQRYAERVGADFHVISDPSISPDYPLGAKFQCGEYLRAGYDRLLFVDSDTVPVPDCPDLFAVVPPGLIGLYDDWPGLASRRWLVREYAAMLRSQGWRRRRDCPGLGEPGLPRCLNTGVIVAGREHAALFDPPERPFPITHCSEQNLTNLNFHRRHGRDAAFRWFPLPAAFNWQWWANRGRFDAHPAFVYHFAGMSQIELGGGGHPSRLAAMRALAEKLYPDRGNCRHRSLTPVESQSCCGERADPANDVYGCELHERCSTGFAVQELSVRRCRVCLSHSDGEV